MSTFAKIAIGIGGSLLIIAVAAGLFLRHLVTRSFPPTSGSIRVDGLHAPVDVFRDPYGVPHIKASDEHDLMFAAGYVHAQDRLWQMDLLRRAGEGRLSEIFGRKTLDMDKLFRTVGMRAIAARIAERLHPDSRRVLEEYAEGVNAFIGTHKGRYPVEFDMLNYEPEPWKVEQSVLLARLTAWELNLAWWTDLTYGEIAAIVPPAKLREILPPAADSAPAIVPSVLQKKGLEKVHAFLEEAREYRTFFGLGPIDAGSNGWVVNGSRSISGKPLLANDPHLAMPAPSRWYELHLSAPGIEVSGVSIPGAPLVVIGHNDRIAWGLTNAMIDDADFYLEKIDSTDTSRTIVQKSTAPITFREEKIFIRPNDSLLLTVRSTMHGPIVNDVHPTGGRRQDSSAARFAVSMRWTGSDPSDEFYGFYLMNRARTPGEFEEGLKQIAVPGQAVVYADVDGTIAYWTTGNVPIRGKGNPLLPLQGWTGESEWKGYIPFDQLPHTMNPPDGIIACANQRIADKNYPYYLSSLWQPDSRIRRMTELLHSAEKFNADDFKQFQQDVVSPYARDILPRLLTAFAAPESAGDDIANALNYLHNWDYRFSSKDIATTIFSEFLGKLLYNIYHDEMGSDIYDDFLFYSAIPLRVTDHLLQADTSSWYDDVQKGTHETRGEIVRRSFADAVHSLESRLGTEMKQWQWGSVHTVTFAHPFGSRAPLGGVFNIGPFPAGGGATTINNAEYNLAAPYAVTVGPSMRQVVDLADPLRGSLVITSGESGQVFNTHYDDQTSLWLNGGYVTVDMSWKEIERAHWKHLLLRPAGK